MRKIIAAGAVVLLLAGCAQKDPFIDLADGNCTTEQAASVSQHISGQIEALENKDWELAHSFASENFQSNVSVADFTLIIVTQYPMLIKNKGYEFNECNVDNGTISQKIDVTSGEEVFSLTYSLTVNGSTLGVESAIISKVASQLAV